jgi:large subunit ribosomal protein L24
MKKYHVKKDDVVEVISGRWKGVTAKVVAILPKKDRIVLDRADIPQNKLDSLGKRTVRKTAANPQGGLIERSVSLHVSNVKKTSEKSESKDS